VHSTADQLLIDKWASLRAAHRGPYDRRLTYAFSDTLQQPIRGRCSIAKVAISIALSSTIFDLYKPSIAASEFIEAKNCIFTVDGETQTGKRTVGRINILVGVLIYISLHISPTAEYHKNLSRKSMTPHQLKQQCS